MQETLFVLLALGCSHDMNLCEEYSTPPAVYSSYEECQTDLNSMLRDVEGYPVSIGKCVESADGSINTEREIAWLTGAEGELIDHPGTEGDAVVADAQVLKPNYGDTIAR